MALIPCSQCSKQISSYATACPACGTRPQLNADPPPLPTEPRAAKGKDSRILKFAVISSFVLLLVGLGWMAKEHYAPSVASSSSSPPMGWTQLVIHLFCVGLPIALVMHIFASDKS
jgi:hypothetical protein